MKTDIKNSQICPIWPYFCPNRPSVLEEVGRALDVDDDDVFIDCRPIVFASVFYIKFLIPAPVLESIISGINTLHG